MHYINIDICCFHVRCASVLCRLSRTFNKKRETFHSPSRFVLRDRRNRRRAPIKLAEPVDEGASDRPLAIEYDENDDATDSTSSPSDSKFDDERDFCMLLRKAVTARLNIFDCFYFCFVFGFTWKSFFL